MTEVWRALLQNCASSQTDKAEVLTPSMGRGGWGDRRAFRLQVSNTQIEFRYDSGLWWAEKQHPLASPGWSIGGPHNCNPDFNFGTELGKAEVKQCIWNSMPETSPKPSLQEPKTHSIMKAAARSELHGAGAIPSPWPEFSHSQPPPLLGEAPLFPFQGYRDTENETLGRGRAWI